MHDGQLKCPVCAFVEKLNVMWFFIQLKKVLGYNGYTETLIRNEKHKTIFKILLIKISENNFILLPAFYLIMFFMKASKNFGEIAILKI